jgi:hypothetical protein
MATITSAQSGDFSSSATWVGGVVPTVGDIAVAANGHVVAIDTDVTLTRVTQLGTGKFTLGGGRTLTADVEAVSGSFTSGGTVEVTATSGSTAYIVGNVTGLSSTAVNICGVNVTGTGTLQLTGNVTGSAGNASSDANRHAAIYTNSACTINIAGNITAGGGNFKRGILFDTNSNTAVLSITGTLSPAAANGTNAVLLSGLSNICNITGNIVAVLGFSVSTVAISGQDAVLNVVGNVTNTSTNTANPPVNISMIGNNSMLNVTGQVRGGPGGSSNIAIVTSGTSTNTSIIGDIFGGNGTSSHAISNSGTSAITTVTGNVTGGGGATAYGVVSTGASATTIVTGNVTGGGGAPAYGVVSTGASSLVNVVGTATATSITSNAIVSTATTNGVVFSGNMISSPQGALPVRANVFRLLDTNLSGITQYADDTFPTGSLVTRVSADLVQGMPSASDVRFETLYGVDNTLEGTLHMPTSGAVAFSVPVDDTVGVLATNASEIADEIVNRLLLVTEENNIVTVPYSTGSVNYSRTKVLDSTRTLQLTEI